MIVVASGVPFADVLLVEVGVSTRVEFSASVELFGVGLLVGGSAGVLTSVPLLIACCNAPSLVDANGQPFPGPFKFWMVIAAAVILPDLSCFESPVGKVTFTAGLLTANPACTFLTKAWNQQGENQQVGNLTQDI